MKNIFDKTAEYDQMLDNGLRLSGEKKDYFMVCRVQELIQQLPDEFTPNRILDFGCGLGETTSHLAGSFPNVQEVIGVDRSLAMVEQANQVFGSDRVSFMPLDDLDKLGEFDLCYCNGVFHHILPNHRQQTMKTIYRAVKKGGYFAVFENNPWNPAVHVIMSRIPFDKDAIMLSILEMADLLRQGNFIEQKRARSLFYFPRILKILRIFEPMLTRIPLGGQYYILATKR
ncbi:MAG: class I SAM-dependent methyltransferase [Magnetococcus sp. THC-1_WYH]